MSNMPLDKQKDYKKRIEQLFEEHKKEKKEKTWDIEELKKHDKILYSTFGFHSSEPPHSIVNRKLTELEKNGFALWGVSASDGFMQEKIQPFCKEIEGEDEGVYIILKFTPSLNQLKNCNVQLNDQFCRALNCKKCFECWNVENDENIYRYCNLNGSRVDLLEKEIFVKGDKLQDKAYYVEKIFFMDKMDWGDKVWDNYYKKRASEPYKTSLLERTDKDITTMNGEDWGIVLKLKAPDYIVECYK